MKYFYLTFLFTGLLLTSCLRNVSRHIIIGHSGDFSGPYSYYDSPLNAGAQFAVDEINVAGGVLGKPLRLISKDCRNNNDVAKQITNELIQDGVSYLIGTTSDPIIAEGEIACKAGIPISTGDGTAPTLVNEMGDCAFQICMSDNIQAAMAAEYAFQQGYRNACLISSEETPYTQNLPLYFQEVFEKLGGKIVGNESYRVESVSFSELMERISKTKADVIFTPMYIPDTPNFLRELRSADLYIPVISTDGNHDYSLLEVGEAVEGLIFTTHGFAADGNEVEKLWHKYKEQTGEFPQNIAFAVGYDEIYFLKQAIESANSCQPDKIIEGLSKVSNFEGVLGNYRMNPQTRRVEKPVTLIGVKDGEFVFIDQFVPSFVPGI
jgi:branched-chain amino acid transport system substrate-binding protein